MKPLLLLPLLGALAFAQPKVSECFRVNELLRADSEHYWATWTNTCPYTIDSVYVRVEFTDGSSRTLAEGTWSLHFIESGAHRTMRFNAPGGLLDFAAVRQRRITPDIAEAFARPDAVPVRTADSRVVGDAGGADVRSSEIRIVEAKVDDGAVQAHRARVAQAILWGSVVPSSDTWKAVAATNLPSEVKVSGGTISDPGEASYRIAPAVEMKPVTPVRVVLDKPVGQQ